LIIEQQNQALAIQSLKIETVQDQINAQKIMKQTIKEFCSPRKRRPNLMEITRKHKLSPKARRFYDITLKLQKEKKRLNKIIHRLKQENKSKRVLLSTIDYKGRKDKTVHIRQQIIDMMLRNDKIAPQVKLSQSLSKL